MPLKMLMIEDNADLIALVEKFIKDKGWEFYSVRMGGEGLSAAQAVRPDVILLDVNLPGLPGWEVCRRLKREQELSLTPVLMVSGEFMSPEQKAQGIEAGADDYLSKPFNLDEMFLRVENILRQRRQV